MYEHAFPVVQHLARKAEALGKPPNRRPEAHALHQPAHADGNALISSVTIDHVAPTIVEG